MWTMTRSRWMHVRRYGTQTQSAQADASARKQRLVVLGTGWGGYAFLKSLSYASLRRFDVKVISPTTSFSFTPLLAQASCATLDFRSVVEPIHSNRWMEYHHAWCDAVDLKANRIELTSAFNPQFRLADPLLDANPASKDESNKDESKRVTYSLQYDYLVIGVGSYNATFGTKGVKENALFLKDVSDARAIRWRILGLFESANAKQRQYTHQGQVAISAEQEHQLRRLLSFVVVGGGPTGSEFAAELHDLVCILSHALSVVGTRVADTTVPYAMCAMLDQRRALALVSKRVRIRYSPTAGCWKHDPLVVRCASRRVCDQQVCTRRHPGATQRQDPTCRTRCRGARLCRRPPRAHRCWNGDLEHRHHHVSSHPSLPRCCQTRPNWQTADQPYAQPSHPSLAPESRSQRPQSCSGRFAHGLTIPAAHTARQRVCPRRLLCVPRRPARYRAGRLTTRHVSRAPLQLTPCLGLALIPILAAETVCVPRQRQYGVDRFAKRADRLSCQEGLGHACLAPLEIRLYHHGDELEKPLPGPCELGKQPPLRQRRRPLLTRACATASARPAPHIPAQHPIHKRAH